MQVEMDMPTGMGMDRDGPGNRMDPSLKEVQAPSSTRIQRWYWFVRATAGAMNVLDAVLGHRRHCHRRLCGSRVAAVHRLAGRSGSAKQFNSE